MSKKNLFIFLMLLPSIFFVVIFTYYPIIRGIPMAFQYYSLWELSNTRWVGLENFAKLFRDPMFLRTIPNTIQWVFGSIIFQFIIGFALALFLNKKFRGRGIYQGCVFFPWAVSGFLIGILWRWMYNGSYGVINDLLIKIGLVDRMDPIGFLSNSSIAMWSCIISNIWYGVAFFTIMIQASLQGIPSELYEAAEVDGGSKIKQFVHITVPSIRQVLTLTTLLRFIWIFNFPDLVYALTRGGPGGSTEIMTSYLMNLVIFGTDYGYASALGIILMLIMLCFTMIYMAVTQFNKEVDE